MMKKNKKISYLRSLNRKRNYLIKSIRYYVRLTIAKLLWDLKKKKNLNPKEIKSVLLLRNEGKLGDVITDTALLKALFLAGFTVDIVVTEENKAILQYNPHIRYTFLAKKIDATSFLQKFQHNIPPEVIAAMRRYKHDLVIDPFILQVPIHRMKLFKQLNANYVLGMNIPNWLNYYSKKIDFDYYSLHVKETSPLIMSSLEKDIDHISHYDLHYPAEINEEVNKFVMSMDSAGKKKMIVINIFAGNKDRCLSLNQLKGVITKLRHLYDDINIVLLDPEGRLDYKAFDGIYTAEFSTIHHAMALIARCDLVISPDTSIVHIAAAYNAPLVAIYQDIKLNNNLWAPGYPEATQILSKTGKLHQNDDLQELIVQAAGKTLNAAH